MKKQLLLAIIVLLTASLSQAQVNLAKQWDHTFGGVDVESLTNLLQTTDGGFLLSGDSRSDMGADVSQPTRGGRDYWIVRTDSLGNKLWDKRFGGTLQERLYSADQTTDGGFILGGFSTSDSGGDISQNSKGGMDFWIVKTDNQGNKMWDKRYGGNDYDWCSSVQQTNDGGYIFGGWTFSDSSSDVSHASKGGEDFWVIKTDALGNKLWDSRFGGTSLEELFCMQQTNDGGYILGGWTSSDSTGDVSQHTRGDNDYWILKMDATGNKLWDKRFGGGQRDNFLTLQQTSDHGYILGGYSRSDMGGDISEPTRDTSTTPNMFRGDAWIVKTDSVGNKVWDKRFGGHWIEDAFGYIRQTTDGGYLMGCASYSNASGDKTENNFGYEQSWIVKTDSLGSKLWDKTLFTDGEDEYAFPIQTTDGCYVIANFSQSDSTGYKTENSRGMYDFWIIKFCESAQPQLPIANFSVNEAALCEGGCFSFTNSSYDASSFQWLFPGGNPSTSTAGFPDNICYADTGHYNVTLIAYNNNGSDTITLIDIIPVLPLPLVTVTQSSDTLFATQGFPQYAWSLDGIPIVNATNYYYVVDQSGLYQVLVIDSNGCPITVDYLIVGVGEFSMYSPGLTVFPNPAKNELNIRGLDKVVGGDIRIYDVMGKVVVANKITSPDIKIQISDLKSGIYFIDAQYGNIKYPARFIKN